ncbi:MAG TPA: hypothetical protein VGJ51_19660 [Candidatus Angelobacter sp.]|jgi:hypothetical protein
MFRLALALPLRGIRSGSAQHDKIKKLFLQTETLPTIYIQEPEDARLIYTNALINLSRLKSVAGMVIPRSARDKETRDKKNVLPTQN